MKRKTSQLDEDIFTDKMRSDKRKFDRSKLIDDAKFKADKETDVEKKRAIFEELKARLNEPEYIQATLASDSGTPPSSHLHLHLHLKVTILIENREYQPVGN